MFILNKVGATQKNCHVACQLYQDVRNDYRTVKNTKIFKLSIEIMLSKRAYIPGLKTGALRLIFSKQCWCGPRNAVKRSQR